MKEKKPKADSMEQLIVETIKKDNPENVDQLLKLIKEKSSAPEKEIMNNILRLQSSGKISLKKPPPPTVEKLADYLRSSQSYWYWTTLTISITTVIIVLADPGNLDPIAYARAILGTIYVLWLPGYTFIRALFPKKLPIPTSSKEMDAIERIALSMGMSIALVPLTGLLLNYTPWGIRTTPITLSLLALTLVFATTAVIREYSAQSTNRDIERPSGKTL